MTRHVWPSESVAAHWATRDSEYVCNQKRTLYAERGVIYSYGAHFPIARHVANKRGHLAVFFTTRDYSPTTAHHKMVVRNALRGTERIFFVWNVLEDNRTETYMQYLREYQNLDAKCKRARNRPRALANLYELVKEINAFASFFRLRQSRLVCPVGEGLEKQRKRVKEVLDRYQKDVLARIREHTAEMKARTEEAIQEWSEGRISTNELRSRVRYWDALIKTRLRLDGDFLETSTGFRVSREEALRVFKFLIRIKKAGKGYVVGLKKREKIQTGDGVLHDIIQVDKAGTVCVGCSIVHWDEIIRVAKAGGQEALLNNQEN